MLQKLYGLPSMSFLKSASDGERRYRASQYRGAVIDLENADPNNRILVSQDYACRRAMSVGFMQHEIDFIAAADYLARRRQEFMRVLPPGDPAWFDEGAIRILEAKILEDLKERGASLELRMEMYSLDIRLELPPPFDRDVKQVGLGADESRVTAPRGYRAAERHAERVGVELLELYGTVCRKAQLLPKDEVIALVEEFGAAATHNLPAFNGPVNADLARLELHRPVDTGGSRQRTATEKHHAQEFFTAFDGVKGDTLMVKLSRDSGARWRKACEIEKIGATLSDGAAEFECPVCPKYRIPASQWSTHFLSMDHVRSLGAMEEKSSVQTLPSYTDEQMDEILREVTSANDGKCECTELSLIHI